jgi:LPS O-antigen subunit length determinant protein (WzzB/FepE family)
VIISTPIKCATKPVSQVGDTRALLLSLLLLIGSGITVLLVKNRRHEVTA